MEHIIKISNDYIIFSIIQNKDDYPNEFFKNAMLSCFKHNKLQFLKYFEIEENCKEYIEDAISSNNEIIIEQLYNKKKFLIYVIAKDKINIIKKYNINLADIVVDKNLLNADKCLEYMIDKNILTSEIMLYAISHRKDNIIRKLLLNNMTYKEDEILSNKIFLEYPELYRGDKPFLNYACIHEDLELVKTLLNKNYNFSYEAFETKSEEIIKLLEKNRNLLIGKKTIWILAMSYIEYDHYEDRNCVICDIYYTYRECEERREYYNTIYEITSYTIKELVLNE